MSTYKLLFIGEHEKKEKPLARSHTQRFEFLMRLIRINKMLKKAKIVHTSL